MATFNGMLKENNMSKDKEWQVGDRVQWYDWKDKDRHIFAGVITALTMETREVKDRSVYYYNSTKVVHEQFVSKVMVKWDDGEEETLNYYDVAPEDTPLEREFRNAAGSIRSQINENLSLANKYLSEAEKLANENGIPFSSNISALGQDYFPPSFEIKWNGVSKRVMEEATGTHNEYNAYYGWEHSQVGC